MTHYATIECSYERPDTARTVERALSVETARIAGDRSRTRVSRDDATLVVEIEAADPTALRAAKNTWFSLVAAAEDTVETAASR